MNKDRMKLLEVARGDAPADLLLSGGKIVNVFNGAIHPAEVAIGSPSPGLSET